MFSFLYEKIVLRLSVLGAFCAVVFLFVYAFFADGTIFAPKIEHAPFVERDSQGRIIEAKFKEYSLDKPHRTAGEISAWLSVLVSDAMSFELTGYADLSKELKKDFTREGFNQYQEYLKTSGIFDTLKDNGFRISTYIDQPALLLNDMEMDKVYRWLYEVPITITFLPIGQAEYNSDTEIISRKMTLQTQIGRVNMLNNDAAIQIESWAISTRR
jgi:hypothetical protein